MKPISSLLRVGFSRALFSWNFVLSVIMVTVVLLMTSIGMINPQSDVLSVAIISGSGNIPLIVGILPLLPFAITFASEWEERAVSFWIIRSGVRAYAFSKLMVSAASGFLTTFTGILLHVLLLRTQLPLYTIFQTGDAYAALLDAGKPWTYLLSAAAHLSLSSALFAVMALWISAYIPNKWTALTAPVVLYFVMLRLTRYWDIPPFLNPGMLVEGTYHAGSPLASLLFKFGMVTCLIWLMGYGTIGQIGRRVRHD